METQVRERFFEPSRDARDELERCRRSRVEIDDRVVGRVERTDTRHPGIDGYAAELDEVQQGRKVAAHESALHFALRGDVLDTYAIGYRFGSVLLKEQLAPDTIGRAFEHERAIGDGGQYERGGARIVAHHVTLGYAGVREEQLVEVRHLDGPARCDVERAGAAVVLYGVERGKDGRAARLASGRTTGRASRADRAGAASGHAVSNQERACAVMRSIAAFVAQDVLTNRDRFKTKSSGW